jgi:hypothetical protein
MMRKFGFLFLSLVVIAIFFGGFFLYFIPVNKAAQDKYAFLILQNINSNLHSKIETNIVLYTNRLKKTFEGKSPGKPSHKSDADDLQKIDVTILPWNFDTTDHTDQHMVFADTSGHSGRPNGVLYDIGYDSLIYLIYRGQNRLILYSPLKDVVDELPQIRKSDFFQYFLILKLSGDTAKPVYNSEGLNLGTEVETDSLLPGSKKGFYPNISDISTGDVNYKMFYIPANINGNHFVICGLKNARDYQSSLHQVSSGFIYPIVIVLLLLLIILPLIKLYIMGPDERVNIGDYAGYFFSLFAGSMCVTLIIIHIILLKDSDKKVNDNLHKISAQINNSFRQELGNAYTTLTAIDSMVQAKPIIQKGMKTDREGADVTDAILNWMSVRTDKQNGYYNFDKVSWIDSSGMQFMKGQTDGQKLVFTDVSARSYFHDWQVNNVNRLDGKDSLLFTFEPVYNWVDGSFRIIMTKRSIVPHAYIISLSTIMYSFSQTILPPGYGYCMIDRDGEVLVHSDSSHNLNENFFDEVEDNRELKGSVKARQELYIPGTKFYGKKNALLFEPVNGLPYYLISFYDNGNVMPVNMRILIFALLFCMICFLISLVLWLSSFWRRFTSKPLLFSAIDYLNWIIPRKKDIRVYYFGFLFLLVYISALVIIAFLTNKYAPQSNHFILILLLQTPVNVTGGLMVIAGSLKGTRNRKPKYILLAMAIMWLICVIWYQDFKFAVLVQFIVFELIVLLFLVIACFKTEWLLSLRVPGEESYMIRYTLLVEAMVVAISVLPAGLFTWYSHNQEILQAVKKDQLSLAVSLDNRGDGIYSQLAVLPDSVVSPEIIDGLHYGRGIYPAPDYAITHDRGLIQPPKSDSGYENFYFAISDQISNDYYNEGFIPALKDTSWDRSWIWARSGDTGLLFRYSMKPDTGRKMAGPLPANLAGMELLNIRSNIPRRYIYLSDSVKLTMVVLIVFILLCALYLLIRRISEGVFLKKFIEYGGRLNRQNLPPYYTDYRHGHGREEVHGEKLKEQAAEIVFDYTPGPSENKMNEYEQYTISELHDWKAYYEFVLHKCSPSEKYLLYNFAVSGFINYKNVAEIYRLLDVRVLQVQEEEIRIFSIGFRAYMIRYFAHREGRAIVRKMGRRSAWQTFKTPFMILLLAVAAFVFFTREEAWQRFSALITGLSTSIPLLFSLFKNGGSPPGKDSGG